MEILPTRAGRPDLRRAAEDPLVVGGLVTGAVVLATVTLAPGPSSWGLLGLAMIAATGWFLTRAANRSVGRVVLRRWATEGASTVRQPVTVTQPVEESAGTTGWDRRLVRRQGLKGAWVPLALGSALVGKGVWTLLGDHPDVRAGLVMLGFGAGALVILGALSYVSAARGYRTCLGDPERTGVVVVGFAEPLGRSVVVQRDWGGPRLLVRNAWVWREDLRVGDRLTWIGAYEATSGSTTVAVLACPTRTRPVHRIWNFVGPDLPPSDALGRYDTDRV